MNSSTRKTSASVLVVASSVEVRMAPPSVKARWRYFCTSATCCFGSMLNRSLANVCSLPMYSVPRWVSFGMISAKLLICMETT